MFVLLNGQFVPETQAVVPVNDRGFMYGDGLFETLRVCRGRPFRLAQHLERLRHGAEFLKIKCPFTPAELQNFAGQLIEKNRMPDAVLRVVDTIGPRFGDRNGGYVRIVRTGWNKGDGADKAFIELLGSEKVLDEKRQKRAETRAKRAAETKKAMEEAEAQAKTESGAEAGEEGEKKE